MKTLFIASGPIEWASSRLRCFWPAEHMQDTKVLTWDTLKYPDAKAADSIIFQKTFNADLASELREQGKRIYWDLCDPVHWFSPAESRENLKHCDGVVLCNDALKQDFDNWSDGSVPSYCIPDRINLKHFPIKRVHADVSPVRLIWFGLSVNRWAILSALANLERLAANGYKIELTIMDNQPGEWPVTKAFPIYCVPWSLDQENAIIAAHDIAVLPPYPGPWGKVKSNNRMLTATACGLPWCDGLDYDMLKLLMDASTRISAYYAYKTEYQGWLHPRASSSDWEAILCG